MKKIALALSSLAVLLIFSASPSAAFTGHGAGGFHGGGFRARAWSGGGGWHGGGTWHGGSPAWHGGGYHGWHGGGWHGSVVIGVPWVGYPYAYGGYVYQGYPYAAYGYPAYPAYPPAAYASGYDGYADQGQYIEQAPLASGSAASNVWYYCPSSGGYYPSVQTCSESWVRVPATPQ